MDIYSVVVQGVFELIGEAYDEINSRRKIA